MSTCAKAIKIRTRLLLVFAHVTHSLSCMMTPCDFYMTHHLHNLSEPPGNDFAARAADLRVLRHDWGAGIVVYLQNSYTCAA